MQKLYSWLCSKVCSESSQISKMDFSAKIANGFQLLNIFGKAFPLDV